MQSLQAEHLSSGALSSFELLPKGGPGMVTFVCPPDRATDAQISSQMLFEGAAVGRVPKEISGIGGWCKAGGPPRCGGRHPIC